MKPSFTIKVSNKEAKRIKKLLSNFNTVQDPSPGPKLIPFDATDSEGNKVGVYLVDDKLNVWGKGIKKEI